MSGTALDAILRNAVEEEDHFNMRKCLDASEGFWAKFRAKLNSRLNLAPAVITRVVARAAYKTDWLQCDHRR
jgi:hypothetical protein